MTRLRVSGRAVALVAAVLLAAVATFSIVAYIQGIEARAYEGAEVVPVFVAGAPIPVGTTAQAAVQQGLIAEDEVPRDTRPPGAITELGQISGLVALADILPGEVLQAARFGQEEEVGGDLEVPAEMVAMSVEVPLVPGLAGHLDAGDRISVIAHVEVPEPVVDAEGQEVPQETPGETRAQFLVQDVEILRVGPSVPVTTEDTAEDGEATIPTTVLVTLALRPDQAEQLVFANFEGQLYFTLLPEDGGPVSTTGRTFDNLFGGSPR